MRTLADRIRRRTRAGEEEAGFTLIEVVIGLLLFALVGQGLAAALITSAATSVFDRMSTTAKNLAQQRIDAMRSLPYHVDAQNGPYVDLLDLYYPSVVTTSENVPDIVPGQKVPGSFDSTGGNGGPSGPYYLITIDGSLLGSDYSRYTEQIYSQFLISTSPAAKALPLTSIPATYDNATVGADQPPSPLLGVTVVLSWTTAGNPHSYTTFTEISNEGTDTPLIVNQAKAVAIHVVTQDYLANSITADVGSVVVNGSLSNGSQAGADAVGAQVSYDTSTPATVTGEESTAVAPPNPSGSVGTSPQGSPQSIGTTSGCGGANGWAGFGYTQVGDVSATTSGGLPVVPTDADSTTSSAAVTASLLRNGGGSCTGMWLTNAVDGSPSPTLAATPMVSVQDLGGSGNEVTGAASLYTGSNVGSPGAIVATATATTSTWVKILPGLTLPLGGTVPDAPSGYGISGTPGLVNVELTQAMLACSSAAGGVTDATLTYSGSVAWYTASGWHEQSFSWPSTPMSAIDLGDPVDGSGTPLSDYISSISAATGVTGDNGVQSVEAALAVATTPTLGSAYPWTTIGVELGHLSCVTQDNRS